MLWHKGWLETRFRLLFTLGITAFLLAAQHAARKAAPGSDALSRPPVLGAITLFIEMLVVISCAMLAGAGIFTQASVQAAKGLHGSTQFTLSLPVSRLRLLAVRATIGWLEWTAVIASFCYGIWRINPVLRATTAAQMAEYAATLILCTSVLYGISVFLATFLDDQWRTWGTMIAAGAIWWLFDHTWLPSSINIVQAIGRGSPLLGHAMPWTAMAFSVALAAIFFFAALKVVQTREY